MEKILNNIEIDRIVKYFFREWGAEVLPAKALRRRNLKVFFLALVCASLACALQSASAERVIAVQCGKASWYELRGRTASGEMNNPEAMTGAHRSLPFGTKVKVTNRANGKSVIVRINDRGPFVKGRVVDVSRRAAVLLGFKNKGVTRVRIGPVDGASAKKCE